MLRAVVRRAVVRRAVVLAPPLVLVGCFTTAADFKDDAETFIEDNQELSNALQVDFTSATCQQPERQDVGTTFPCTALDDQSRSWEFSVEITGSNQYEVNVSRRP